MLSVEQLERYQPWIDNGRQRRDLAHQLETPSLEAMRTAEGWDREIGRSLSTKGGARSRSSASDLTDERTGDPGGCSGHDRAASGR